MSVANDVKRASRTLRISDLQTFYFVIIAIFIFTGFIYNFIYFRLFDIKVEQFFTLQDYLAASIEKVYLIIIAILFAVMSSHVARYFMREKQKFLHHRIILAFLYGVSAAIFVTGILAIFNYNKPWGYFLLSFAVYTSLDYFLFKIVFKSDHDAYSRYFYLTVFIFYPLLVISTVIYDHDTVLKKSMHSLKNYQVHFTRNVGINPDNCVVLEANSNYFFFYDKMLKKAYVIPKEGICYIETTR